MVEEPNVGLLMFIAHRAAEAHVMQRLRDEGFELTVAQARVLQRVGPDGTRLTDLAAQAQVTKQTAGFLVDQLERTGYVERAPDPTDARARLIVLGERAIAALPVASAALEEVEAQWRRHLGQRRFRELRESLLRLREITDPYA